MLIAQQKWKYELPCLTYAISWDQSALYNSTTALQKP